MIIRVMGRRGGDRKEIIYKKKKQSLKTKVEYTKSCPVTSFDPFLSFQHLLLAILINFLKKKKRKKKKEEGGKIEFRRCLSLFFCFWGNKKRKTQDVSHFLCNFSHMVSWQHSRRKEELWQIVIIEGLT